MNIVTTIILIAVGVLLLVNVAQRLMTAVLSVAVDILPTVILLWLILVAFRAMVRGVIR